MLPNILVTLLLLASAQTAIAQQQVNDPLYPGQWYLKNTKDNSLSETKEDINVEPVWNTYRGSTRTIIAIIDGDLPAHTDLIENVSTRHSVDYYPGEATDSPHATRVAGIAAARGYNGIGIIGVAPLATMYSLNILADIQPNGLPNILTENLVDAMQRNRRITAVSNNSWGPTTAFEPIEPRRSMWEAAVNRGITEGFYGNGTVYVWSVGDNHCREISDPNAVGEGSPIEVCGADSANYNNYANHHTSVAVCAVNHYGKHSGYSEFGANLWVCAPSNDATDRFSRITTTDKRFTPETFNAYTAEFGGTAAAAPMVSGVVALMRQANPNLSWRDVKIILANSARQNDPMDSGWQQGSLEYGSFSGENEQKYQFSHKYGFGVVHAQKAVELAENWTPLPARAADTVREDIVSNPSLGGVIHRSLSIQSNISFIEYVDISVTFRVNPVSDLSMKLISPSGTISNLMIPADRTIPNEVFPRGVFVPQEWRFGSSRHLGEDPSGTWRLELETVRGGSVELTKWELKLRGYRIKMDANAGPSDSNNIPVTLSLIGTKWKEDLEIGDFRLKNAPVGLNIINVARTSDTQVQLDLKSEAGIPKDYLFHVVATTGTVSSFAKPLSSDNIEPASFEVQIKVFLESAIRQFIDVCDRTPQVRDKIVALTNNSHCSEVSQNALEAIAEINFFDPEDFFDPENQGITSLAKGDFSGLSNVSILNLSVNPQLSLLPSGVFEGLDNLSELRLSSCNLGANMLSSGSFSGLPKLRVLILDNNNLSANRPATTTFSGLRNLLILNLFTNNLGKAYCDNLGPKLGLGSGFLCN